MIRAWLRFLVVTAVALPLWGGASLAQDRRSITVGEAEAEVRAAEQQPGNVRGLVGPLVRLGWAYWRAGRQEQAVSAMRRVADIMDRARQPTRTVHGRVLSDLGYMLVQSGRTNEASQPLERALQIVDSEPELRSDSYVAGQTYWSLGQVRILQGRSREGQALMARAITAREEHLRALTAQGASPGELGQAHDRLARAYSGAGRIQEAVDAGAQAVSFGERGSNQADLAQALVDWAFNLRNAGRNAEAEAALTRALAVAERASGTTSALYARALAQLGRVQNDSGRLRQAEETLQRALVLTQRVSGNDSMAVGAVLSRLGQVAMGRRSYVEAEQRLQQSIAIIQRRSANDPNLASPLSSLARTYRLQSRESEAEQMLGRAITIAERGYGPDHLWTNQFRVELVRVLIAQNRHRDALPIITRVVATLERTAATSRAFGLALVNLSMVNRGLNRMAEAETASRHALTILQASVSPGSPALGDSTMALARSVAAQNKHDEAISLFRTAIATYERGMGADYPDIAWARSGLATTHLAQGQNDEALAAARGASALLRQRNQASGGRDEDDAGERLNFRQVFVDHVRIAHAVMVAQPANTAALTAEGFAMVQQAQEGGTAAALARMADRFSAGDDALAQRLRERSDMQERVTALDRQLAESLASSSGAVAVTRLRNDMAAGRRALRDLDRRIAREFPSYRRLISSEGVTLGEVQRALADDEALVNYLVALRETYVFVVRRDRAVFLKLDIGGAQIATAVRTLRQALDPTDVTSMDRLPNFDLARSHELYRAILAPAEEHLAGVTHLFIVPDRGLQSLPFNVLVTAPPGEASGAGAYRTVPWLVRRYATSTLPSASALRALRELARPTRANQPFIGFGDPDLRGRPGDTRSINSARLFLRSGQANLQAIRELSPLPETADELRALARALGAPDDSVHLRTQATVRLVRAAPLARYRVVAFATHGLTAGELTGFGEPGLILTPPSAATPDDDGILSASEIAALQLDADWVILSACNTAAADGTPGAEALSGLARAFFYAGSRALLVSHWAVASVAAQQLTTTTFEAIAREPGIGRAEGLRRAMIAMIAGEPAALAHPLFWAPFVVVGEGGRGMVVNVEPPAEVPSEAPAEAAVEDRPSGE